MSLITTCELQLFFVNVFRPFAVFGEIGNTAVLTTAKSDARKSVSYHVQLASYIFVFSPWRNAYSLFAVFILFCFILI